MRLPLLGERNSEEWIVNGRGGLSQPEFLHRVLSLADRLPEHRYAVVLIRSLEHFLTAFCAAAARCQTAILCGDLTEFGVRELAGMYPDSYVLVDTASPAVPLESIDVSLLDGDSGSTGRVPKISVDQEVALLHTSGSTGKPTLHGKTWGAMLAGAARWRRRFGIDSSDCIVATVPSHHMYGFEASVLLPLNSGAAVYAGRPLYPTDVSAALERCAVAPTLVTTPTHLSAYARSDLQWPPIRQVISSTAALDAATAQRCEERMKCRVMEVFGSTETGAIASRRTVEGNRWSCLRGLEVRVAPDGARVMHADNGEFVRIADTLDIHGDGTFDFLGRTADILKIAGKRASLAGLNRHLTQIEGIEDGVFLNRRDRTVGVERLTALVVAPGVSGERIRAELACRIDSVFLPRKIVVVDRIPRDASGKVSHAHAHALLDRFIRRCGQ